jgi:anti-sigma factor RsiW
MNCDDLWGALHGYVERRLPPDHRADFERHLETCPTCEELVGHVLALPCRDFVQFLDDYFEDALPPAERREFDKHMELCPPCVDYLRSYERTIELGREACTGGPVPEGVPDALVEAILAARRAERGTGS